MVSVPADLSVEGPGWKVPDYLLPRHPQARREARPRPHLRLALDHPDGPGRNVGRLGPQGLPAGDPPRRVPPRHPAHRRERAHGPHRPGPGAPGPAGTGRPWPSAKKRWSAAPLFPGTPFVWDNGDRREEPPAAQERRAHRPPSTPSLRPSPCRRTSWSGRSPRSTRPAGHPDTSSTATGCARSNPDAFGVLRKGRDRVALPAGVGAEGRAALDYVGAPRPLSALLLLSPAHRRPRHPALRPHRLRRRDRPDPTSCAWRGTRCRPGAWPCPCGSPTGPPSSSWGRWDAHGAPRTTGSPPRPCRRNDQRLTSGKRGATARAPFPQRRRRAMRSQDDHKQEERPPEAWWTDRCPAQHGGPYGSGSRC